MQRLVGLSRWFWIGGEDGGIGEDLAVALRFGRLRRLCSVRATTRFTLTL